MQIQFIPQYRFNNPGLKTRQEQIKNTNLTTNNTGTYNPISYKDFNISFGARTPENFYEFNSESMPYSMRNYLNYDYNQRKHIPPEQMMHEVFKYIDSKDDDAIKNTYGHKNLYARNFDDVKKLYPNEDLFKNLHPLRKNSRKGILSEIKAARDLSDTPLLKDGSDDFGMYLLKKIYKEGKTLKEISKDFLEKDISEEYKGLITKPVDYSTTAAYGIKFPNNGFWHSFIATREEYKKFFVTLPKNIVDPNRAEAHTKSNSSSAPSSRSQVDDKNTEPKAPVRKYNIQKYKKNQLKNDIKSAKGDIESVEKAVRKRFSKDDPEASFIIKYLSPIMTVAAEKVHLSEEMKYFFEFDKGAAGRGKMERFWKSNPELLENYSTAITDTIELFEDAYDAGGLIPINNSYEQITSESLNQKPIDYVTPYFLELLNHTQTIKPTRDKRYADYDIEQQKWEAHFKERYGDVVKATEPEGTPKISAVDEALNRAKANNPGLSIYNIELANGTRVSFALNFEEVATSKLKAEYINMPKSFVTKYTKYFLNHPKVTEKVLFSLACAGKDPEDWCDMVHDMQYSDEELKELQAQLSDEIAKRTYSIGELYDIMKEISTEFEQNNPKFMDKVKQAIMEYSTKLSVPDSEYLKELIHERMNQMEEIGLIPENISPEDRIATYNAVHEQAMEGISSMKSHNIVYLGSKSLEAGLSFLKIGNTMEDHAVEMDKIMHKYNAPLTNNERNKIVRVFMDTMLNMDPENTESFKTLELSGFYKSTMETLKRKENASFKKEFVNLLLTVSITPDNTTLRYLIDPNADKNLLEAKVEFEVGKLMQTHIDIFKMIASLDDSIMEKYIKFGNPSLYQHLQNYRQTQIYKRFS